MISHAIEHARAAIAIDALESSAYGALAYALVISGKHQEARVQAGLAIDLNPNSAWAHGAQGYALAFDGQPNKGIEALTVAMRLSPFDPLMPRWLHHLARAYYFAGDYSDAIRAATQVCQGYPEFGAAFRTMIAALGQTGQTIEAKRLLDDCLGRFGERFLRPMLKSPPELRAEDYERMLDGYRKAGWEP